MSSLLEDAKNAMDAVRGYIGEAIPPLAELFDLDAAIREVEGRQAKCEHIFGTIHGELCDEPPEEARKIYESWRPLDFCPRCGKELRND